MKFKTVTLPDGCVGKQCKGWMDRQGRKIKTKVFIPDDEGGSEFGVLMGYDLKAKEAVLRVICKECEKIFPMGVFFVGANDSSTGKTMCCFDPNWWVCPNGCNLDSIEKYIERTKLQLQTLAKGISSVYIKSIKIINPGEAELLVILGCSKCAQEWLCMTNPIKDRISRPDLLNCAKAWACPNGCNKMGVDE
jgi:hypothetical protein